MIDALIIVLGMGMAAMFAAAFCKSGKAGESKAYESGITRILAPPGLVLLRIAGHRYGSGYENKLESKFLRLAGREASHTLLKMHIARSVMIIYVYMIFVLLAVRICGASSEALAASLLIIIVILYMSDRQIDIRIKARKEDMERDFPVFLNKLVIMLNAGLTVSGAVNRIVREYKGRGGLYMELGRTINDIAAGKPEIRSYEDFALRCRMAEASMFVSILVQNLRKGSGELAAILRLQSASCWEGRKNAARRLGEEASAKLLLPMMMIFAAILIMVMAPAAMQMNL